MRFWITKNSEVPVHEQLVRQIMLAILSEDLPAGHRLPSIRALARRCGIHSNTVSAAYHDLLDRGWLELRRGSGMFVRPSNPTGRDSFELDMLLTTLLRTARSQGHEPIDVLHRLEQLVLPRGYARVMVAEPDAGMREILQSELSAHLQLPVDAIDPAEHASIAVARDCLVAALPTRAGMVRERISRGTAFFPIRLRSVVGSIAGQARPSADALVSIVSRSPEFRRWARPILIAVGLNPECLCDVDTAIEDWRERAMAGSLVITDVVAARGLPPNRPARVFSLIADSCLVEMKQLCQPEDPAANAL